MKKRAAGGSLVGVLLLISALSVGAFAVANLATWSLQMSSRQENQQIAVELADSALHQAMAQLMLHPEYGQDKKASITIQAIPGMPSDARALLTFDPSLGEAYSTNNLAGTPATSTGWNATPIASSRTHLVATGRCRGLERRVEIMVYRPRFPRAIACEGPVELHGSLVAAVKNLKDVVDDSGNFHLSEDNLSSGDVVCNDKQFLREDTRVKGSAQARLAVVAEDTSVVEGEVLAPCEQATIPHFRVSEFDPQNDPDSLYDEKSPGSYGSTTLTGITRFRTGGVNVNGDLTLDNATLYVDGDLRITGSLQGVGAVLVKGETQVGKAVRLTSRDNVALLSQGDIRLRGDGNETSFFQGLLLTQGALSADRLTIMGSAIARERIWISRCRVLYAQPGQLSSHFRKVTLASDRADITAGSQHPLDLSKGYPVSTTLPGPKTIHVRDAVSGSPSWDRPGAVIVEKTGGKFLYTYQYMHRSRGLATYGPDEDRQRFIREVSDLIFNEKKFYRYRFPHPFPAETVAFYRDCASGLNQALDDATTTRVRVEDQVDQGNFDLSPNRFLSEAEHLRVLYRREL